MRREICWKEKTEDGVRREVRVHFFAGSVRWQYKRSDSPSWEYDTPPTKADWEELLVRVENRYRRRGASHDDLELVRRLMPQ